MSSSYNSFGLKLVLATLVVLCCATEFPSWWEPFSVQVTKVNTPENKPILWESSTARFTNTLQVNGFHRIGVVAPMWFRIKSSGNEAVVVWTEGTYSCCNNLAFQDVRAVHITTISTADWSVKSNIAITDKLPKRAAGFVLHDDDSMAIMFSRLEDQSLLTKGLQNQTSEDWKDMWFLKMDANGNRGVEKIIENRLGGWPWLSGESHLAYSPNLYGNGPSYLATHVVNGRAPSCLGTGTGSVGHTAQTWRYFSATGPPDFDAETKVTTDSSNPVYGKCWGGNGHPVDSRVGVDPKTGNIIPVHLGDLATIVTINPLNNSVTLFKFKTKNINAEAALGDIVLNHEGDGFMVTFCAPRYETYGPTKTYEDDGTDVALIKLDIHGNVVEKIWITDYNQLWARGGRLIKYKRDNYLLFWYTTPKSSIVTGPKHYYVAEINKDGVFQRGPQEITDKGFFPLRNSVFQELPNGDIAWVHAWDDTKSIAHATDRYNRWWYPEGLGYFHVLQLTDNTPPGPNEVPDVPEPCEYYEEKDGTLVIEVELYDNNVRSATHEWVRLEKGGAAGDAVMVTDEKGLVIAPENLDTAPRLDYNFKITEAGEYTVACRAIAIQDGGQGYYVGIDGKVLDERGSGGGRWFWLWNPKTITANLDVGMHRFNLWLKDDGGTVDRCIITKNSTEIPADKTTIFGPSMSTRGPSQCVDGYVAPEDIVVVDHVQARPDDIVPDPEDPWKINNVGFTAFVYPPGTKPVKKIEVPAGEGVVDVGGTIVDSNPDPAANATSADILGTFRFKVLTGPLTKWALTQIRTLLAARIEKVSLAVVTVDPNRIKLTQPNFAEITIAIAAGTPTREDILKVMKCDDYLTALETIPHIEVLDGTRNGNIRCPDGTSVSGQWGEPVIAPVSPVAPSEPTQAIVDPNQPSSGATSLISFVTILSFMICYVMMLP